MIETPKNLQLYVEALGEELTLSFVMQFGGSPVYIPSTENSHGELRAVLGADGIKALAKIFGHGQIARVPIAREWTIRQLKAKGRSNLSIARQLRVSDETVRRVLNDRNSSQTTFNF